MKNIGNNKKLAASQISVAPMMDWTDRHCRYFLRQISPSVRLYTEMVTTGAILYGDKDRFLGFDPSEHPVALQLGGSDPVALAECAAIAAERGYDEINLNCGCPSDRVQNGGFGAILMESPDLVARCVESMICAVPSTVPVTVKCRIGIDDQDDFPFLERFVGTLADAGCRTFVIHARKAWLSGLSPKENREIPPLNYDRAEAVKTRFPDLSVIVNGGIQTREESFTLLERFDGIMIGREAYQNPWILAELEDSARTREQIVQAMIPYIREQVDQGVPAKAIFRHMLGLYKGCRGGRLWRRTLTEEADTGPDILDRLLENQATCRISGTCSM